MQLRKWMKLTRSELNACESVCVPVYEDSLQTGVDEVGHQGAVIPADGLYAFAVHLVMCVCTGGEVKASISLLVDQQVWVVDLCK